MDFVLGYFAIGLFVGLVFAIVNFTLSLFEGAADGLGAIVAFAFGFLLWPFAVPVVLWAVWKERS